MIEYDKGRGRHRMARGAGNIGAAKAFMVPRSEGCGGYYLASYPTFRVCTIARVESSHAGKRRAGVSLAKVA